MYNTSKQHLCGTAATSAVPARPRARLLPPRLAVPLAAPMNCSPQPGTSARQRQPPVPSTRGTSVQAVQPRCFHSNTFGGHGVVPRLHATGLPLAELASAPDAIYEATGVPLVAELLKLGSVSAAAWHSLRLLVLLGAAAVLTAVLLRALDGVAGRRARQAGITGRFSLGAAALVSTLKPCQVMLPLYCATRALTVVLALAEVAATKCGMDPASLIACRLNDGLLWALRWLSLAAGGEGQQVQLMGAMRWATQLAQDCSELVLIVAAAWAVLELKGRLIDWAAERLRTDSDIRNDGIVRLLRLGSSGLSVAILILAAAITLTGFGVRIGPLLASVGGIGVVVGLATQQLLANIVAAVSLYSTRPFVTGDRVQLVSPEGVEIAGTVLNIEPTRTILKDDGSGCIVHISNADIGGYIVKNASQYRNLSRLQELAAAGKVSGLGPGSGQGSAGAPAGEARAGVRRGPTMPELVEAMRSADLDDDVALA